VPGRNRLAAVAARRTPAAAPIRNAARAEISARELELQPGFGHADVSGPTQRSALRRPLIKAKEPRHDRHHLYHKALSDDWIVTVRAKALASPEYPGAKDLSVIGYPSLSIRKADTPPSFSAPDDNISLALYDVGWLKAGPAGKFVGARRMSDYPELFGLRNVGWGVELGGFVELWPTQNIRTRFELRHGIGAHNDFVGNIAADWVQPWGRWTFSVGPRLTFVGDRFADKYFSVTPLEAAYNGRLTPFTARGGLEGVGGAAAATYQFSPQWAATAFVHYERLVGDAGISPLTSIVGTRNQFTFGANIAYTFSMRSLFHF
jgi:outer membrane protein